MKNLYLHIGLHKTGSTSIQHYLFDNRAALLKHGWYYPCEGSYYFHGERSQSYLAHAVLDRHPDYLRHELVLNRDRCIAELQRDVSASKCENILISSEHFSYATTEEEWRGDLTEIAAKLTETCRQVDPTSTDKVLEQAAEEVEEL